MIYDLFYQPAVPLKRLWCKYLVVVFPRLDDYHLSFIDIMKKYLQDCIKNLRLQVTTLAAQIV